MKFATVRHHDHDGVVIVDAEAGRAWPVECASMLELIGRLADGGERPQPSGPGIALDTLSLLAPIPRPARNIFCVGKNYLAHAQEFTRSGFDRSDQNGGVTSDAAIVFSKVPECVVGPGASVRYPEGVSDMVDYEAELAVVIGRGGRGIAREDAYAHVLGYMVANDVTARDLQERHKQWLLGKSLDTFCPLGPWLVTADEVNPAGLEIRCWINGELRQSANTVDLIFDIPAIIEAISAGVTLMPGDIILTGTPEGVGIGFSPPRFLNRGDHMAVEISGLGRLENVVA